VVVLVSNYVFSKLITFRKKNDEPMEAAPKEENAEEVAEISREEKEESDQ
jgi:hypothetical protein